MDDLPRMIQSFVCHGFEPRGISGDQHYGSCPFCLDNRHFYINHNTGQYQCKVCGKEGNLTTFLTTIAKLRYKETSQANFHKLSKVRELPVKALRRFKLGCDGVQWLLPCFNAKGSVLDIRRWRPSTKRVMSTTGCKSQMFGLHYLAKYKPAAGGWVWICEGEWDVMALAELLSQVGRKDDCVVGVPGANTFKSQWIDHFSRHKVRVCYDNDDAGDKGSKKAGGLLANVTAKVEYLCWPESRPPGWDVRDHIVNGWDRNRGSQVVYRQLRKLFQSEHRRPEPSAVRTEGTSSDKPEFLVLPKKERPTFQEVVDVFARWVKMDSEMVACLRYTLAVCLSQQLPGDPLWTYLVGASGAGKTLTLMSLVDSDRTIYRSTVGPHSLVSGFRSAADPSLLAQAAGMILCFKDATEVFAGRSWDLQEMLGTLRGAYDGHLTKTYGNGVIREYNKLHFTVLMGITDIVHAFPDATLGERFLKFIFKSQRQKDRDERLRAAMRQVTHEQDMETTQRDVVSRFLARTVATNDVLEIPLWLENRLVPLVTLISALRTQVTRNMQGEVLFRPTREYGTRLIKQLAKLAVSLAMVESRKKVTPTDYTMVERIALDTAMGLHADVMLAVQRLTIDKGYATPPEIRQRVNMPNTTVGRHLQNLCVLEILKNRKLTGSERDSYVLKRGGAGAPPRNWYTLTKFISRSLDDARIGQPVTEKEMSGDSEKGRKGCRVKKERTR